MSATTHQIVVFRLGEEEYAFGVADVHEIIGPAAPRPVSSPDPWVRGIISLRGRIVPVLDLATRLGVAADGGLAAVVNLGDRVIALLDRSVAVAAPVTA